MAERRMFAKTIIDSDAFLDMPLSSQSLYFHLAMRSDDDGFINNPKKIQRMIGASDDDYKLLIAKNFIIPFESGIVVIKHWKIHNYIQKDRYKETVYKEEKSLLITKTNNAYTLDTECIQDVYALETQDSIGKDSIEIDKSKDSIDKDNVKRKEISNDISKREKSKFVPPTVEEVREYCLERGNNIDPEYFVAFYESKGWMVGKNKMKNWKMAIITWEKNDNSHKDSSSGSAYIDAIKNRVTQVDDWV